MAFPGYKTLGVDLSAIQTAAQLTVDGVDYPTHTFGTRVSDDEGNEYVYVKANGAIAAPEIVEIAAGYDVTVTGAAVGQAWAVARGTTIPDNGAGWVQVKGIVDADVAAGVAAAGELLARRTEAAGHLQEVGAVGVAVGDTAVFAISLEASAADVASIYIF
jgi:hypothetical protein